METEQAFNCDEVSFLPMFHQGQDTTRWAGYVAGNHSPFPQEGLGSGTTEPVSVITCYSMTLKTCMMKCGFLRHSPLCGKRRFLLLLLADGRKVGKGVRCKVVEERRDDSPHWTRLFPKPLCCETTCGSAGYLLPHRSTFFTSRAGSIAPSFLPQLFYAHSFYQD